MTSDLINIFLYRSGFLKKELWDYLLLEINKESTWRSWSIMIFPQLRPAGQSPVRSQRYCAVCTGEKRPHQPSQGRSLIVCVPTQHRFKPRPKSNLSRRSSVKQREIAPPPSPLGISVSQLQISLSLCHAPKTPTAHTISFPNKKPSGYFPSSFW